MNRITSTAALAAMGLVCASCGGDDTDMTSIQASLNGLETLSSGTYEGWLIYGEEKVSTGIFQDISNPVMMTDRDPEAADKFVITIEPDNDTDPAPSGVIVLAGDISGRSATLSFPVDLSTASGGFILKTPTDDATNADNDSAGVWFLNLGANGPEQALTLPDLPAGWVYEGWGVTQGVPLSTGRFTSGTGADQASPYSDGGPPFPGEDFVMDLPAGISGAVDLADGNSTVVISVEPDIGGSDPTGDGPFALKPLAMPVPSGLAGGVLTNLGAGPTVTVSGSVTF